jgi:bifunctional DNA primase/polymerase-like protein
VNLSPEQQERANARERQMLDSIAAQLAKQNQPQSQSQSDPFDFTESDKTEFQETLKPHAQTAVSRGFHIFGLTPKDKVTLPGSHGFKDSKSPSDPSVLSPWDQDPNRNIGIDLGASDLCVLDFDKPESIPAWLNEIKTFKVKTAKGVHVYFRGAQKTTKLCVDGNVVGDVKSQGGYILATGSIHPSGAV